VTTLTSHLKQGKGMPKVERNWKKRIFKGYSNYYIIWEFGGHEWNGYEGNALPFPPKHSSKKW